MITSEIVKLQRRVGTEPDGFWGRKSVAACEAYLKSFFPKSVPWPEDSPSDLQDFYGKAGDEDNLTRLNVKGLGILYDGDAVSIIRCHKKVAESLLTVLEDLSTNHPYILKSYAGVFNNRQKVGGSTKSLHAYGAAIDLNPAENGNKVHWPILATMPIEVMEAFSRQGWISAGAFWSRDAMHFQATK